jgi:hypothetical protein
VHDNYCGRRYRTFPNQESYKIPLRAVSISTDSENLRIPNEAQPCDNSEYIISNRTQGVKSKSENRRKTCLQKRTLRKHSSRAPTPPTQPKPSSPNALSKSLSISDQHHQHPRIIVRDGASTVFARRNTSSATRNRDRSLRARNGSPGCTGYPRRSASMRFSKA